jgi:methylamine dehydrogenase accessory protein MauD
MDALMVSNALLWLVVIVLGFTVLALARQVGVLYERIAPAGALMIGRGPGVGDPAPRMELETLAGPTITLGGASASGRSTLLFFLSPTCPICDTLLPVLRSLRVDEGAWLDIVLASDGDLEEQRDFHARKRLQEFPYVVSTALGLAYQVGKLPFAVLIDEHGIVRAKGLTNNREHLESLFEAKERGVSSIQDYVAQHQAGGGGHQRDVA